jgi:hypothetical protein
VRREWPCRPNRKSFDKNASSHCLPQGLGPRRVLVITAEICDQRNGVPGKAAGQQ